MTTVETRKAVKAQGHTGIPSLLSATLALQNKMQHLSLGQWELCWVPPSLLQALVLSSN